MTDPATLSVEVEPGTWRTPATSDLTWTTTAPGGCYSAESVVTDRSVIDSLAPDARVLISDPADGTLLWDGDLRDPSGKDNAGRRTGSVTHQGSVMRLYDRKWVLPYVVAGPDAWITEDTEFSILSGTRMVIGEASQVSDTDGVNTSGPALRLQMRQNSTWAQFRKARGRCAAFDNADLKVGGIRFDATGEFGTSTAADWHVRVRVGAPGASNIPIDITAPPYTGWTPGNVAFAGDPGFPSGQSELRVELSCEVTSGSGLVNSDNFRVDLSTLFAIGTRMNVSGGVANHDWVHQARVTDIVEDVCGRSGMIDPNRVTIVDGGYRIDGLNYQTPVGLGDILTQMLGFDSSYQWMVQPSSSTLHPFNYQPWPTEPRYVISQSDGAYKETVAENEILNRVSVRFKDRYGRWQVIREDADPDVYPATRKLTEQGRVRDLPETLELLAAGSWTNARQIARAILRDVAQPRVSATFGTARPVLDLETGVRVHPWQVRPGYLALVQETGNAYRITQTVCDGHAGTTNLTMGNPAKSADQLVANLTRRRTA